MSYGQLRQVAAHRLLAANQKFMTATGAPAKPLDHPDVQAHYAEQGADPGWLDFSPVWHRGGIFGGRYFSLLSLAVMPVERPADQRTPGPLATLEDRIDNSTISGRILDLPLRLHVSVERPLLGSDKPRTSQWHLWLPGIRGPIGVHPNDAVSVGASSFYWSSQTAVRRAYGAEVLMVPSQSDMQRLAMAIGETAASIPVDRTEQMFAAEAAALAGAAS